MKPKISALKSANVYLLSASKPLSMHTFQDFKIKKQLANALEELGYEKTTPIQQKSFSPIMAGKDFVGISQTGTGKTIAYLLPILQELKYSESPNPRVLILAPTRELVIQIVDQIQKLTPYISVRATGVFGGSTNMKHHKAAVGEGLDIIVGTPRRLFDLLMSDVLNLKSVKKVVIDEVDLMLDFGFKKQLQQIFQHLPSKKQHILFSATMTDLVEELIDEILITPVKEVISISGTPLENISQSCYEVKNFYTKVNLLNHLLRDREKFNKVLVFVDTKMNADRVLELTEFPSDTALIHAGKEQNYRVKSLEQFASGEKRILITTDVIARGIDIDDISTVINLNVPFYPENYIHRIGRTGRAEKKGEAILFHTEKEAERKQAIERLMNYSIPAIEFPEEVKQTTQLTPEEKNKPASEIKQSKNRSKLKKGGDAFHEKKDKNKKTNQKKLSYNDSVKQKYGKSLRRGDKIQNMKKKRKKR